jgi:DNA-directed RNA polymerase subunit RPC12/RpoP
MGKFGNKRIPKFMMGEPIPESHEGRAIHPEILSLKGHGEDHAMIIIKTHDGQEVELRFDYDGDGMLTAQHGDHEYSIPVEIEIVSGMDESSQVDEISNTVKRSAFMKAWNREKDLDPEKEGFRRNKAIQQAHAFQTHINPEIKREAQSIANMFGDGVTVEVKKAGGGSDEDYTQAITLEFYEGRQLFAKVIIYSDGRVDKVGQFPENIQRRLVRFIDKVRYEELSKPTKGYELAEAKKGGKPDYLDFDGDGDKKEPMKQALKDKKKGKAAKTFENFVTECWSPMEEGYSPAMSEEAKQAIKKVCEDILIKEAQMCDEDMDSMHTYENYLNEVGSYMTKCMTESAANLNVNESTAYSCDTCGERAEHEEIEENPNMRCSNCGDRSWSPEY